MNFMPVNSNIIRLTQKHRLIKEGILVLKLKFSFGPVNLFPPIISWYLISKSHPLIRSENIPILKEGNLNNRMPNVNTSKRHLNAYSRDKKRERNNHPPCCAEPLPCRRCIHHRHKPQRNDRWSYVPMSVDRSHKNPCPSPTAINARRLKH